MNSKAQQIARFSPDEIRRLARQLRAKSDSPAVAAIQRLQKDRNTYPLSFAQERLWFLDRLMPGNSAYTLIQISRYHGSIEFKPLQRALNELEKRHEILRTTFSLVDGRPLQVVAPPSGIPVEFVDLRRQANMECEAELMQRLGELGERKFDLATGPLFRCAIFQLRPQEFVLAFVIHHIIVDGWSKKVFLEELSFLSLNGTSSLPELPIQYGDYAVWERQRMQGEVRDRLLAYWKKRLQGLSYLELPADHPRPSVQSFLGKARSFLLPESLSARIRELARQEGLTPFVCLLATFQVLLMRYTGQQDIAVAVPFANRNRVELEGLIGLFVNTLVMRSDLAGNPSFRELLKRVGEVCNQDISHGEMPFEKLVEELQPKRDLSRTPLCQVAFQLENIPFVPGTTGVGPAGLPQAQPLEFDQGSVAFDLQLYMMEAWDRQIIDRSSGTLRGTLTYCSDLFDPATMERFVAYYQRLLEEIVANPDERVGDLSLLSRGERQQLLEEWNETRVEYARPDACLQQLFEEQVRQTPEAPAVMFVEEQLSYRELDQRANQLAHYLRKLGVGAEVRVGICVERGLPMMVALLGVMKAGGAYVPLDPKYPAERIRYVLEDSAAPVLLTQQSLVTQLPAYGGVVVRLDGQWQEIGREIEQAPHLTMVAENLAYVIYTSGSTGKPKGVQICHRALVNLLNSLRQQPGIGVEDVLLAVTTMSFDMAWVELYLPLVSGGRVKILGREDSEDGRRLLEQVSSGITVMQATPASWQMLLEAGWKGTPGLKVFCGGEAMTVELANQLVAGSDAAWNMYGPTETTVYSLIDRMEEGQKRAPIGKPIGNTQAYVLDNEMEPVPTGVMGELYVGGEGLARGYLNRSDLTAERFVPHPFSHAGGERLYRTGDLVRYLPEGRVEYIGRSDQQIKIRGYRIEPGEIESALRGHAAIRQAAVMVHEPDPGNKWLVAYVVAETEAKIKGDELREYLRGKLPEYMLPSAYMQLDELPLTPNGKLDRRALPHPNRHRLACEKVSVPPRDAVEQRAVYIWEEILKLQPIGIQDDFFELGGHSLLAVRLITRMENEFHCHLNVSILFQHRTIEELAVAIRQSTTTQTRSPLVPIQPAGWRPPLFLVYPAGAMCYRELASHLGIDQPVYGLEEPLPEQAGEKSIEAMAAGYIASIRALQPAGPYFLGGWSLGGVVAFEMACQLLREGDEIALLALIDTTAPIDGAGGNPYARFLDKGDGALIQSLGANTFLDPAGSATEMNGRSREERELHILNKLAARNLFHPEADVQQVHRFLKTLEFQLRAAAVYSPRQYPGKIMLFRSAEAASISETGESKSLLDAALGWQRLSSQAIAIHLAPGTHFTMMAASQAVLLAQMLKGCLTDDLPVSVSTRIQ